MTTFLVLEVATAVAIGFVCRSLMRLAANQARIVALIADAFQEEAAAGPPPPAAETSIKCRVHGCGWLAVEDGYCEEHGH